MEDNRDVEVQVDAHMEGSVVGDVTPGDVTPGGDCDGSTMVDKEGNCEPGPSPGMVANGILGRWVADNGMTFGCFDQWMKDVMPALIQCGVFAEGALMHRLPKDARELWCKLSQAVGGEL